MESELSGATACPYRFPPRVFDTLVLLVRRAGQLVRKDDMLSKLWPETHVSEANLTQNIWLLRRALGEEEGRAAYVETVPKAGYRFVAPVERVAPASAATIPASAVVPTVHPGQSQRTWTVVLLVALLVAGKARKRLAAAQGAKNEEKESRS